MLQKTKTVKKIEPEESDHELLGYKYASSGQYEKAIEQYKNALEENPNSKDLYYNIGFIYAKIGELLILVLLFYCNIWVDFCKLVL